MTQFGFFYDQSRCTGCHACSILCKSWNDLPPGPIKWMRVFQWEKGTLPDLRVHVLAVPCYHCADTVCLPACPGGAIHKEERFGAVLVDRARCEAVHQEMDCRRCWQVCPYGAPQFASDDPRATMSKCTMCVDRLYEGKKPVCVLGCSLRALDFDTMDNLRQWYGPGDQIEGLPRASKISPSVLFKKSAPKRQLVPWDAADALRIWQERGPFAPPTLPPVFSSIGDVTEVPPGTVGRDRLVLKPRTVEQSMYYTMDDE
ncbi:MAG: 4Fe-4S dicluster domain-containing protein [Dehalococcoidales bacterium]|nr:4Fe-4S dicluster domain-containing protein [Dehalococcoidales bacterium]